MDISARKLNLIAQLMGIVNLDTIARFEKFFEKEILENEVSDDLKKVLDLGLEQINEGNTFSTKEVMNRVKAKYNVA